MNVNLRQLRSFVTIARRGSFTSAAKELHLSQPALTVQIRQLEDALSVRLIDRNTRSVALTTLGRQLLPIVERALGDLDIALAGTQLSVSSIGILNVAALPSMCSAIVPRAIAKFATRYPGISVRLREVGARNLAALLVEREIEFGIGVADSSLDRLDVSPFLTDHLAVVVPTRHPLCRKKTIVPADLVRYPMIALESQYSVRSLFEDALRSGPKWKAPAHEVAFISTAMGMVRAGLGITVLSTSSLSRASMDGLVSLRVTHSKFAREIVVVKRRGSTLSPAADALLEDLMIVRNEHRSRRGRRGIKS